MVAAFFYVCEKVGGWMVYRIRIVTVRSAFFVHVVVGSGALLAVVVECLAALNFVTLDEVVGIEIVNC